MLRLMAETRASSKGARSAARRQGKVPAVVYGKEMGPTPIQVDADALRQVLRSTGHNRMITLSGLGAQGVMAMIKDVQMGGPGEIIHVDFFQPAAGQRIHVKVPLLLQGEEHLLKRGVILEHQLHDVECTCLVEQAPDAIYIDVGGLQCGEHICFKDLAVPEGVQIIGSAETLVLLVDAPIATMVPANEVAKATTGSIGA